MKEQFYTIEPVDAWINLVYSITDCNGRGIFLQNLDELEGPYSTRLVEDRNWEGFDCIESVSNELILSEAAASVLQTGRFPNSMKLVNIEIRDYHDKLITRGICIHFEGLMDLLDMDKSIFEYTSTKKPLTAITPVLNNSIIDFDLVKTSYLSKVLCSQKKKELFVSGKFTNMHFAEVKIRN